MKPMPTLLTTPSLDSDRAVAAHFLPYQYHWTNDEHPLRLAEKSVRIGWTYADAFKNVRKRIHCPNRDYLFSTKDYSTAIEFVRTCWDLAELFKVTQYIVYHSETTRRVPRFDAQGRDTGFTDEVKMGLIKFTNRARIMAFSSNPNALRAFGGDVGLDEFAFHPAAEQLWAAASGRATWGYDIGLWSSSNGDTTLFHIFAREAEAGQGGWSYHRVTLLTAVAMGLVEKISSAREAPKTREEFIADCKRRARLPEVFEQEYMCNPRGGTSTIVPWPAIELCQQDYAIERLHLEEARIIELFAEYRPEHQKTREAKIARCLAGAFACCFAHNAKHCLGFDVAASGQGDLAAIYVDEQLADFLQLRMLFTCRTQDWHFLKTVLHTCLKLIPTVTGCGDETGLGRQICWETARVFHNCFFPINFRAEKHDLGFELMNQLCVAGKRFPRDGKDIAADFYALRKTYQGSRWVFSEGANPFSAASHCDIAWAGALSSRAAKQIAAPGAIKVIARSGERHNRRRAREL
jgi:phage FluMu gp28-like protein